MNADVEIETGMETFANGTSRKELNKPARTLQVDTFFMK